MRQIRTPGKDRLSISAERSDQADIGPAGASSTVLLGVLFIAAVAGGYLGTLVISPPRLWVMILTAAGGAAAAFLILAVPAQTYLLVAKTLTRLRLSLVRTRLGAALEAIAAAQRAQDNVQGEPQAAAISDAAVAALLRGAPQQAESDLLRARELAPDDLSLGNNLGVALAAQRRYAEAASILVPIAAAGLAEAHQNLGALAAVADDPAAVEPLAAALGTDSTSSAFNNIGVMHLRLGQTDLAAEYFAQAQRRDPRRPAPRANLGIVAYRRGRLREATRLLVAAGRAAPEDARIASDLGVALAAAGRTRWARAQLDRAHELDPANIGIRLNHFACVAVDGDTGQAISGLRALTSAPYHRADVLYNLAVLELATGENELALSSAVAAVEAGEKTADGYTNLGIAYWETGGTAEALEALRRAAGCAEAGPATARNLGRALLIAGHHDEALKALSEGRERWRSDSELALDMGLALLGKVAARYRPTMSAVERRDFYVELHRSFAGLHAAVRLRESAPIEAHIGMGLYHYLRQEYEEAAEQFGLAARADASAPELQYLLGTTYGTWADHQRQQHEDGTRSLTTEGLASLRRAVTHLRAACESTEASPDWFYNLARCHYGLGDYEEGLAALRKAPGFKDSAEMNILAGLCAGTQARAWMDLARGQTIQSEARRKATLQHSHQFMDAAVQYFRQALHLAELNASLHGNLGLAYMLRNREHDVESALRHWQRMRAITGERAGRRYTEFSQIESAEHASRVRFDDTDVSCREIDPLMWLAVRAPQMAGLHFIMEPVAEGGEWRLAAHGRELREALRLRDRIASLTWTLARLEAR